MSATKPKFLCLFRFPVGAQAKQSSAEEMQKQYAAWTAWMKKFETELVPGGPLKREGGGSAIVRGGTVTDGPYIEAKEVIASYTIIEASSLARAVEIIKETPLSGDPDYSVEIREMGY
jgi:hypothetical protein